MPPKPRPKPPSTTPSTTSPLEPLDQLKQSLSIEGSIITNPSDAKKHLENAGLISPDQALSQTTFAEILLTLVVTAPTRRASSDRIPERIANIIKAVALLLDGPLRSPTPPPSNQHCTHLTSTDPPSAPPQQQHISPIIAKHLEDNATFIKQAAVTHAETTAKVNALIERFERLQERSEKTVSSFETASSSSRDHPSATTPPVPSYRDSLVNGKLNPSAHTPSQHKLLNRIGIKACQILLDFAQDAHLKLSRPDSPETSPAILVKAAINTWLNSPEDRNGAIPKKAAARVVQIFGNSRVLIEMNSLEAADWMRSNSERILGEILKCKVSLLKRSFTVLARFVPVMFDISPANLRGLKDDHSLPANSILNATWVKDPSKWAKDQKFANLKIFCSTPGTANSLITGPAFIHSSHLCIQKDTKSPGVCNKCQKYGHIARDCSETIDTCGFCGQEHCTSICNSTDTYKCTPCGSTDHPTNSSQCPTFIRLAQAIIDKDPESSSAYFLTDETWTWGNHSGHTDRIPPPPGAPFKRSATLKNRRGNLPHQRSQPLPQHHQHQQRTLPERGFTIRTAAPRHNPPPQNAHTTTSTAPDPNPNPNPNLVPLPLPPSRRETANPEAGGASNSAQ